MALLLAKGDDLAVWRGVDEFVFRFQDEAIRLASVKHPEGISGLLETLDGQLAVVQEKNDRFLAERERLLGQLSPDSQQGELPGTVAEFYRVCYQHYRLFGSPQGFFESANRFMQLFSSVLCEKICRQSTEPLPPLTLLILGPAGRLECTRFCRIQLALVHGNPENSEMEKGIERFSTELVAWFRSCGIPLDESVTPVHSAWRGTLEQWQERIEQGMQRRSQEDLIELLRLVDQTVVFDQGGIGDRFRKICLKGLVHPVAITNLVDRCAALSNGLGLMGGLKLEKTGPHRGRFPLLDHALVPLSASVSAFAIMASSSAPDTPARLKDLVKLRRLDVDLAERGLQAWHLFSRYRINLELDAFPGQDCRDILNLDPEKLGTAQLDELRDCLQTVEDLQRMLQVAGNGYR
jgi:signal-transduction protein with cAMP-binding, CBS, and nucleotidyltransferase domain